jgi:hypothetical protein
MLNEFAGYLEEQARGGAQLCAAGQMQYEFLVQSGAAGLRQVMVGQSERQERRYAREGDVGGEPGLPAHRAESSRPRGCRAGWVRGTTPRDRSGQTPRDHDSGTMSWQSCTAGNAAERSCGCDPTDAISLKTLPWTQVSTGHQTSERGHGRRDTAPSGR